MSISSDLDALIGNGLDYNWDSARAQILQGLTLLDQGLYNASGHTHAAADIVSGTLANARVNWASPSAIGGTAPAAGTFTGLTVTRTSNDAQLVLGANAGQNRYLILYTGANARWSFGADTSSESGANAGSDLAFARYNDAGVFQGFPLTLVRSTGKANFEAEVEINGDLNHDGSNVGFYGATPVARGALAAPSGTITRTTFATGSVTLPQLAERVYAIINDLRAMGLFS